MPPGIITLLTDFGTADAFVGIMKGVILGINRRAHVVDLTHDIPPQQILPGALVLRSAVRFFPEATVHVAIIDPGVGSARRPIVIETSHGLLVGPDNGVLSPAAAVLGCRQVRLIENTEYVREPVSQTFHGRDIFAPVAAHLSRGVTPDALGPRLDSIVELSAPQCRASTSGVHGEVIYVDHFGNLVTNITADALAHFPVQHLSVSIDGKPVAGPVHTYAAVPEGAVLALVGSWGVVEIAVRSGSAAQRFAAGLGTPVTVVGVM